MKMRLAGVTEESCVDGPGLRFVVFMQGCHQACPGCHNPASWDENGGRLVEVAELVEQIVRKAELLDGVTLSGGEPFLQTEACLAMVHVIRKRCPQLSIMVYSGYTFEELVNDPQAYELLASSDILVDGPFMQENRTELAFRGSSNQRILDSRKSLLAKKAVSFEANIKIDGNSVYRL